MIARGYIVLIAGGALFATGIALSAIWGMQFAGMFLQDNTIVSEVSIGPGQSIDTTRQVTDTSRPLTVAVHIREVNEEGFDGVKVLETVRDPSGAIVDRNEFSDDLFTSFRPEVAGEYVLTINNTGTESVAVDGTFGYMPFVDMADGEQVDFDRLAGIVAGGILTVVGLITIIAGIVIAVVDGRNKGSSTTTGEGGITYRKD